MHVGLLMQAVHNINFKEIENPSKTTRMEIDLFSELLNVPASQLSITSNGYIFYTSPERFTVFGLKHLLLHPETKTPQLEQIAAFLERVNLYERLYIEKAHYTLYQTMDEKERLFTMPYIMQSNVLSNEEKWNLWLDTYKKLNYNHDRILAYFNPSFITKANIDKLLVNDAGYIQIYRGMTDQSTPAAESISWTIDLKTACFFANRYPSKYTELAIAKIHKDDIHYYDPTSEGEVLVNPEKVIIDRIVQVGGTESLTADFSETYLSSRFTYRNFYATGIAHIQPELFENPYGIHGVMHTKRVLFHTLIQCMIHERSWDETIILMMVAVYHDIGRIHDEECEEHGYYSLQLLEDQQLDRLTGFTDDEQYYKIFDFIVEYHCKSDETGYEFLENSDIEDKVMARELFDIFKDADALDRVRLRDLDVTYLRLDQSRLMTKFAEHVYQFIQ